MAQRNSEALRLLALTWTYHADTLLWLQRYEEVFRYVDRVLLLTQQRRIPPKHFCVWCASMCARYYVAKAMPETFRRSEVTGARRKGYKQALEVLDAWVTAPITHFEHIWLHRDRATYLGELGEVEQAQVLLGESRRLSEEHDVELAMDHANFVEGRMLARNGRASEGLPLLVQSYDRTGRAPMQNLYTLAQAYLALGERNEAERILMDMTKICANSTSEHEHWRILEIQQQMEA